LAVIATTVAFSCFFCFTAHAQVTSGYINSYFPNDFPTVETALNPTSSIYSSNTISYLLDGQAAPVTAEFESYYNGIGITTTSTGNVTIVASSPAFVSNVSQTLDITQTNEEFEYQMNSTIQQGIDGDYNVLFVAINDLGSQVAQETTTITVWSSAHVEAANMLSTASSLILPYSYEVTPYSYEYGIIGNTFSSPEGKANQTLATIEYATAMIAYNNKDWNDTEVHAQNSINLIKAADTAESEADLQGRTVYLLQILTYPFLIITVLVMLYIIAVIYRKIYPPTKTAKASDTLR
jgi:hypothetical protein